MNVAETILKENTGKLATNSKLLNALLGCWTQSLSTSVPLGDDLQPFSIGMPFSLCSH